MGSIKYIDVDVENGKVVSAKVDMGSPVLEAKKIPVLSENEKRLTKNYC